MTTSIKSKLLTNYRKATALALAMICVCLIAPSLLAYTLDDIPKVIRYLPFTLDETRRDYQHPYITDIHSKTLKVEPGGLEFDISSVANITLPPGRYDLVHEIDATFNLPHSEPSRKTHAKGSATIYVLPQINGINHELFITPAALECDSDFNLFWEETHAEGVEVVYTIWMRSAAIDTAFNDDWSLLASHQDENSLSLPKNLPNDTKYQFRLSAAMKLDGHIGQLSYPNTSKEFIKPACSQYTDTSKFEFKATSENSELFTPTVPNAHGISYNKIETFNAIDKTLMIDNLDNTRSTIIIEADSIRLENHVQVLGAPANLLIINTQESANARLSCSRCSFDNVKRVTLATAQFRNIVKADTREIDRLIINQTTPMVVSHLLAPGAISVELLAGRLNLNGNIITNKRGGRDWRTGKLITNGEGNKILGMGQVHVFNGGLEVDYQTLDIKRAFPQIDSDFTNTYTSTLNGNIESAAISINSYEPLVVNTQLNTNNDIAINETYNDTVIAPRESIKVQVLGKYSDLHMQGGLTARNLVQVHAARDLILGNLVNANRTVVVAGNKAVLQKNSVIRSSSIEIAADTLENLSHMQARNIEATVDSYLYNHFGGRIVGEDVKLVSLQGTIRNGSLKPYRAKSEASVSSSANERQSGSYYQDGNSQDNFLRKEPDLSAHIFANSLEIHAHNIENINPYYRLNKDGKDWSQGTYFESHRISQVSMVAYDKMTLNAPGGRILNSSAEITLYNQDGLFSSASDKFINERYRTDISLAVEEINSHFESRAVQNGEEVPEHFNTTGTNEIKKLSTNVYAMSPPGNLYVAGNADFFATDSLLNDLSYLEVLGAAKFSGGDPNNSNSRVKVQTLGVLLENFFHQDKFDPCDSYGTVAPDTEACYSKQFQVENKIIHFGRLDTVFMLYGDVQAADADYEVKDRNMLKDVLEAATGQSVSEADMANDGNFARLVRENYSRIVEYLNGVGEAIKNAWDSLINWFA